MSNAARLFYVRAYSMAEAGEVPLEEAVRILREAYAAAQAKSDDEGEVGE